MDWVAAFLVSVLYILIAFLVVRALLSWFPGFQLGPFSDLTVRMTEPFLRPLRGIIPMLGPFDISAMVAIILLTLMVTTVNRALA